MLVCTNDGFAKINSVKLPFYKQKTVYAMAYDARTEMNTEDFADIVLPCQGATGISSDNERTGVSNNAISENGIVISHPGIMGGNNLLESIHAWAIQLSKLTLYK